MFSKDRSGSPPFRKCHDSFHFLTDLAQVLVVAGVLQALENVIFHRKFFLPSQQGRITVALL